MRGPGTLRGVPAPLTGPRRWAGAAALAVLTATSWFLWTGWAVVVPGGLRFAAWQVTATVVSAVVLAVLAPRRLPVPLGVALRPRSRATDRRSA